MNQTTKVFSASSVSLYVFSGDTASRKRAVCACCFVTLWFVAYVRVGVCVCVFAKETKEGPDSGSAFKKSLVIESPGTGGVPQRSHWSLSRYLPSLASLASLESLALLAHSAPLDRSVRSSVRSLRSLRSLAPLRSLSLAISLAPFARSLARSARSPAPFATLRLLRSARSLRSLRSLSLCSEFPIFFASLT